MKTARKALLVALCCVLLVAASVLGTLAYLTDSEAVTNTFTVGKVVITLDEADVKTDGTYETDVDTRVTANAYHLIPGHEYIKDPTVHVDDDSENCWLFVKVENGISEIEADTTIAAQMATNGWTVIDSTNNIYAYEETVSGGNDVPVFGTFTVDDNADVAGYEEASINVTAYAVQAEGFATAAAAWAATFGA